MSKDCGCKKRKPLTTLEVELTFTTEEVKEGYDLITNNIHFSSDEMEFLFDLHNRIYPKNKQLNFNCSDCFNNLRWRFTAYSTCSNDPNS